VTARPPAAFTYSNAGNGDKFNAGSIVTVGNTSDPTGYAKFLAPTRLAIARAALYQAVKQNQSVARFRLDQDAPEQSNDAGLGLQHVGKLPGERQRSAAERRARVDRERQQQQMVCHASNGWRRQRDRADERVEHSRADCADSATANADILTILSKAPADSATGSLKALVPVGNDSFGVTDAPVKLMVDDAKSEADRLIGIDNGNGNGNNGGQQCRTPSLCWSSAAARARTPPTPTRRRRLPHF